MKKIIIALCAFCLITASCDLFNPLPEDDLENAIDEAAKWGSAPQITVTVAYPQEWGASPQAGTGRCVDDQRNALPRMGFSFTLQFNPNASYGDAQWRAYRTSELPDDSAWSISTVNIMEVLDNLSPLDSDKVVFSSAIGSITSVIVNIDEAVTIIPYCVKQPRVLMSNPPLDSTSSNTGRSPNKEITVIFASHVDPATLIFEENFIEITGKFAVSNNPFPSPDGNMKDYFVTPPAYDENTNTLTIQSDGRILSGLIIEVKLGTEIKSSEGDNGLAQPIVFSYLTTDNSMVIDKWQAYYDENLNRIEVHWALPEGAETLEPRVGYRINDGSIINVSFSDSTSLIINNIPKINNSGIKDGIPVTGINYYTISLGLGEEQTNIKVWNIPGMMIQKNWKNEPDITVTEITSMADLIVMRNRVNSYAYSISPESQNSIFVLTSDLPRPGESFSPWRPIGANYFRGKFYGNGHTITLGPGYSFIQNSDAYGLFSFIEDAEIRDLCLDYTVSLAVPTNLDAGGLVANVTGNTRIENCIVKSTTDSTLTVNTGILSTNIGNMCFGGMAGYMDGNSSIQNGYVNLNITLNHNIDYDAAIGGVVGQIKSDDSISDNKLILSDIRALGNITCNVNNTESYTDSGGIVGHCSVEGGKLSKLSYGGTFTAKQQNNTAFDSYINVGGIAGYINNPRIEFCEFEQSGNIIITEDKSNEMAAGGIAGMLEENGYISSCFTQGNFNVESKENLFVGGVIGYSNGHENSRNKIINCYASGNVISLNSFNGIDDDVLFATGGIVGWAYATDINKSYASVNISAEHDGSGYINNVTGGLAGRIELGSVTNCYALGNAEGLNTGSSASYLSAGGLIGDILDDSYVKYNFATGNVTAKSNGNDKVYAGGIVGNSKDSDILNNAALGSSITIMGGSDQYAARIYGYRVNGSSNANFAFNNMKIKQSAFYSGVLAETTPTSDNAALPDGKNSGIDDFRKPDFWLTITGLSFNFNSEIGGINGIHNTWNFNGIEGRGYPLLTGLGVQQ